MNIDNLTIKEAKEIATMVSGLTAKGAEQEGPYVIGKNYLVRTVTMIVSGELKAVYPSELVFKDAAWIADTGRFHDNLKSCEFNEVEPFINDVIVGRGAIVDVTIIEKLPRNQK